MLSKSLCEQMSSESGLSGNQIQTVFKPKWEVSFRAFTENALPAHLSAAVRDLGWVSLQLGQCGVQQAWLSKQALNLPKSTSVVIWHQLAGIFFFLDLVEEMIHKKPYSVKITAWCCSYYSEVFACERSAITFKGAQVEMF